MLKIETWITKNGKKVTAVVFYSHGDNRRIVLTFDYKVISRITGFSFKAINELDCGVHFTALLGVCDE